MNNPSSTFDNYWEWIEIRNTGGTAIDLKGYLGVKLGSNLDPNATGIDATVFGDFTTANGGASSPITSTVIPAGGIGIIYDGFNGTGGPFAGENFDPNGFYAAWNLDPNLTVVMPANFFPALSNSGSNRNFGFYAPDPNFNSTLDGIKVSDRWPNYMADRPGGGALASFDNAEFSLNYGTGDFPNAGDGESVVWNGNGDNADGNNWQLSSDGDATGAYTSVPVPADTNLPINSAADLGNPGLIPGGTAPAGLVITEILYNPAGTEPDWEWIEVLNNTGSAIDFGADPNNGWVIDDRNPNLQSGPNITGTLGAGEVGILYNSDEVTAANFLAAWDPNGVGLNLLEVTGWSNMGLSNPDDDPNVGGGDIIGIWSTAAAYNSETVDPNTNFLSQDSATVTQSYLTDDGFIIAAQGQSIFLGNLGVDPNDGANWPGSVAADFVGSFNATEVFDPNGSFYHDGGDQGSPGVFIVQSVENADFDGDGVVTGLDFLIYQQNIGATGQTDNSNGDANGDGVVGTADLAVWEGQYGTSPLSAAVSAVPEPSTVLLTIFALAPLGLQRRRQS